jgi:hypothetical protein
MQDCEKSFSVILSGGITHQFESEGRIAIRMAEPLAGEQDCAKQPGGGNAEQNGYLREHLPDSLVSNYAFNDPSAFRDEARSWPARQKLSRFG